MITIEFDSIEEFVKAIGWGVRLGKYEKIFSRTRLGLLLNIVELDHNKLFAKFCNSGIFLPQRHSKEIRYIYYPDILKAQIKKSNAYNNFLEDLIKIGIKIGEIYP